MNGQADEASEAFARLNRLVGARRVKIEISWRPGPYNRALDQTFDRVTWSFQWKLFLPIAILIAVAVPVIGPVFYYFVGGTYDPSATPTNDVDPSRIPLDIYTIRSMYRFLPEHYFVMGMILGPFSVLVLYIYSYCLKRARIRAMLRHLGLWNAAWKNGLVRLKSKRENLGECNSPDDDWAAFVSHIPFSPDFDSRR